MTLSWAQRATQTPGSGSVTGSGAVVLALAPVVVMVVVVGMIVVVFVVVVLVEPSILAGVVHWHTYQGPWVRLGVGAPPPRSVWVTGTQRQPAAWQDCILAGDAPPRTHVAIVGSHVHAPASVHKCVSWQPRAQGRAEHVLAENLVE